MNKYTLQCFDNSSDPALHPYSVIVTRPGHSYEQEFHGRTMRSLLKQASDWIAEREALGD